MLQLNRSVVWEAEIKEIRKFHGFKLFSFIALWPSYRKLHNSCGEIPEEAPLGSRYTIPEAYETQSPVMRENAIVGECGRMNPRWLQAARRRLFFPSVYIP